MKLMNFKLLVVSILCSATCLADSGADKFTPTKLQWLALKSAASCDLSSAGVPISLLTDPPNTIILGATYIEQETPGDLVDKVIETCKKTINTDAHLLDWKWVNIKVVKRPQKKPGS